MPGTTAVRATPIDPTTAVKYGLFVQAAYEMYDLNPGNLNPPPGPTFPKGYTLVSTIQMTDFFRKTRDREFYGFIARSIESPIELVFALRGTRTHTEWWDDLDAKPVVCDVGGSAGKVAQGFLTIYKSMGTTPASGNGGSQPLPEVLSSLAVGYPLGQLIVAGHSLGAALITLLALDANSGRQFSPTIYTFASPRLGDKKFVTTFNSTVSQSYRIYNVLDAVPYFPKDYSDNYYHVKGGFEIDSRLDVDPLDPLCTHTLNTYLYELSGHTVSLNSNCKRASGPSLP